MRTSAPHLPCFLFQVRRREFALRCATDEILQELFGQHCMPAVQVHVPVCAKSPNIPTPFFSRYTSSAAVNLNAISSLLASVHSDYIGREPERPYSLEGMLVQVVKTQEARQHYFRDHVGKDRHMNWQLELECLQQPEESLTYLLFTLIEKGKVEWPCYGYESGRVCSKSFELKSLKTSNSAASYLLYNISIYISILLLFITDAQKLPWAGMVPQDT